MFLGDSNQCPSEWLSRMLPLSYTRYKIQLKTPLTQLIKSHDTVAQPTFINSSSTHNLSRRPFSPKNQRRLLSCLLYKSFFYGYEWAYLYQGGLILRVFKWVTQNFRICVQMHSSTNQNPIFVKSRFTMI